MIPVRHATAFSAFIPPFPYTNRRLYLNCQAASPHESSILTWTRNGHVVFWLQQPAGARRLQRRLFWRSDGHRHYRASRRPESDVVRTSARILRLLRSDRLPIFCRRGYVAIAIRLMGFRKITESTPPNHALQRTRPSRPGCNPRVRRAGSLSSGS